MKKRVEVQSFISEPKWATGGMLLYMEEAVFMGSGHSELGTYQRYLQGALAHT